jgi:antitoxin component of MazEF toxin-antitoxin module
VRVRCQQKIVRTGNTARITLPRQLLFALGLVPGDYVNIEAAEGKITLFERYDPDSVFSGRPAGVIAEQPAELKR